MKQSRVSQYPQVELRTSNKDWNKGWFYLKKHALGRLPDFTPDRVPLAYEPPKWAWGLTADAQKGLQPNLKCLAHILRHKLSGFGIIETYYRSQIALLMARPLRLLQMVSDVTEEQMRPTSSQWCSLRTWRSGLSLRSS